MRDQLPRADRSDAVASIMPPPRGWEELRVVDVVLVVAAVVGAAAAVVVVVVVVMVLAVVVKDVPGSCESTYPMSW
jgi:hypothetical protein